MRVAPEQLTFLGLVALDEVVHHCQREPYPRTFALRATLAMLQALAGGDRRSIVAFWRACAIPNGPERQVFGGRQQGGNEVGSVYGAICRAMAGGGRIAMGEDVAACLSVVFGQLRYTSRRGPGRYFVAEPFVDGCDAFCFGGPSFLGLRASLLLFA